MAARYLLLTFAILALNILSNRFHWGWDITEDKIYSLSPGSRNLLAKVDSTFNVKFFFSRSRKTLAIPTKNYGMRIEEVLKTLESHSNGKMVLEVIDPLPDSDEEEWARRFGIAATQLTDGEFSYLGAVFIRGSKEILIAQFDLNRERFLEFDLCEAIYRVNQTNIPKIGILSHFPVFGSDLPFAVAGMTLQPAWAFVQQLQRTFEVVKLDKNIDAIDVSIGTLLVIHPKELSQQTQYAIDQFVMRGGKLWAAVDPLARLDLPAITSVDQIKSIPNPSSNMEPLLGNWGIKYVNEVIGDLQNPSRVIVGNRSASYPMFISVKNELMSQKSTITAQLNEIIIAEGGGFSLNSGSQLDLEPLLQTSKDSGIFPDPFLAAYIGGAELDRQLRVDGQVRNLAVMVTGKFKSAFPNGPPSLEPGRQVASKQPHLTESPENAMILIGDTDFLRNENTVRYHPGPPPSVAFINDNIRFISGSVEVLAAHEDLISLRARGQLTRPFKRLQNLEKQAQLKWRAEDARLAEKLAATEKRLNELQALKSANNRFQLSPQQLEEVQQFRMQEFTIQKQRKEVRRRLREDIVTLGNQLAFINIALIPLILGAIGSYFFFRRYRRMRRGALHA